VPDNGENVTLASSGTLELLGSCSLISGNDQAELSLLNTSATATAEWDNSTGPGPDGGTSLPPGAIVGVGDTTPQDPNSGSALAQSVFSALSTDGSRLAVQAWGAAGGALVASHTCQFGATQLQGGPGS
jgi:hypothetical protein